MRELNEGQVGRRIFMYPPIRKSTCRGKEKITGENVGIFREYLQGIQGVFYREFRGCKKGAISNRGNTAGNTQRGKAWEMRGKNAEKNEEGFFDVWEYTKEQEQRY